MNVRKFEHDPFSSLTERETEMESCLEKVYVQAILVAMDPLNGENYKKFLDACMWAKAQRGYCYACEVVYAGKWGDLGASGIEAVMRDMADRRSGVTPTPNFSAAAAHALLAQPSIPVPYRWWCSKTFF